MASPAPHRGKALVSVLVVGLLFGAPAVLAAQGSSPSSPAAYADPGPAFGTGPSQARLSDGTPASAPGLHGPLAAPVHVPLAADGDSRILFRCQTEPGPGQTAVPVPDTGRPPGATEERTIVMGCPTRVVDQANPFADISLTVQVDDPDAKAFTALHGTPAPTGISERARKQQTHTVFQATDRDDWHDHPTDESESRKGLYGEGSAITSDSEGTVYFALLWSAKTGEGLKSNIQTYKAPAPETAWSTDRLYGSPTIYDPTDDQPFIASVDMVTVPAPQGERIVLIAHSARDNPPLERNGNNTTVPTGRYLEAAWTDTTTTGGYTTIQPGMPVGPCDAISEGAVVDGLVYVACRVAEGYDHRARAHPGEIDIFAIDPFRGAIRHVAATPLLHGEPRLATNPDGYMVLTAHQVVDGGPKAEIAFGWHGAHWTKLRTDLGAVLAYTVDGGPAQDADITAVAVTGPPTVAYLVYKHWDRPEGADEEEPNIRKSILAIDECQGPITATMLADSRIIFDEFLQPVEQGDHPVSMVNDQRDSLVMVEHATGPALHFAIGDHGVAQVGEIVLDGVDSYCFPTQPQPILPALASPQATALGQTAQTVAGATLGMLALAMVGYLLTAKRRTAHAAAAGDE